MDLSALDCMIIVSYVVGCATIGIFMKRYVRRVDDFALAGRSVGTNLGVASMTCTGLGNQTESTPISGMPILAAHESKQTLVCNLDARPGYSGVTNPLYTSPRTILLLGNAKDNLSKLLEALG